MSRTAILAAISATAAAWQRAHRDARRRGPHDGLWTTPAHMACIAALEAARDELTLALVHAEDADDRESRLPLTCADRARQSRRDASEQWYSMALGGYDDDGNQDRLRVCGFGARLVWPRPPQRGDGTPLRQP